jgi:hypothetical protein
MVQSKLGVIQIGVAKKARPRTMVMSRLPQRFPLSVGAFTLPPQAVIVPLALRAAKVLPAE